jgi:hypothetical protein
LGHYILIKNLECHQFPIFKCYFAVDYWPLG